MFPGSSAVEQPAVNRLVAGSNPARGATLFFIAYNLVFFLVRDYRIKIKERGFSTWCFTKRFVYQLSLIIF